ncbi:MAG TPA: Ku protein [Planctomycetota bacterium]|nr:Ku protein [Planctomycetota bacterium]
MPRAMWSGAISFGLVNIPIKLFTAVSPKDIHFHQLHDEDGVRIQQKRVCPADGKEVPYEHIVKGYEISPGQYVRIEPKELEALDPKATNSIDIESFVKLTDVDPLYFERSYYLAPDKGAGKAYALLLKAMQETKAVAIAKTVIRTKQYIVLVRPLGHALSMSTLYYADEIVAQKDIESIPENVAVNEKELAMAKQLVESLTTKFQPDKYHDEYRERVLEMIQRKAEGQEIVTQPKEAEAPRVVNLMEALEKSLAASRKGAATATRQSSEKHEPRKAGRAKAAHHPTKKRKTA